MKWHTDNDMSKKKQKHWILFVVLLGRFDLI